MRRQVLVVLGLVLAVVSGGCGGGSDGPSTPTAPTTATPTRVMSLSGSLSFGSVDVGAARESTFTITNTGNAPLTVSGMTASGGFAQQSTVSWSSGVIAAGASQTVSVRFEPKAAGTYNGTFTVNGDQTSGGNTLAISAVGSGFSAAGTWLGRYVVERCDGTGSVQDLFCSANRGLYPVGTSLPITLVLTQNGGSVSGTAYFGQVSGAVSGGVSAAGVLTLQGAAQSGGLTITITGWNTLINGNSLTGLIGFNVGSSAAPGVAAITARLSEVTR